jgi:hypothetical protein
MMMPVMARLSNRMRRAGALVLCAALAAAAYGFNRADTFSGKLCVGLHQTEQVVFRASQSGPFPIPFGRFHIQRGVTPDQVRFEKSEAATRRLNQAETFDVLRLPFALRLDAVEVIREAPASYRLEIDAPGGKSEHPLLPGMTINLDDGPVEAISIRKWAGLARQPGGEPMAAVSLRRGEESWTEYLFLSAGAWTQVEGDTSLQLAWFDSEEAARKAIESPSVSGRWGIRDGEAVNWFDSFQAGAGIDLADGTSILLWERDDVHLFDNGELRPAIKVRIEKDRQSRIEWIPVNAYDDNAVVHFEDPAQLDTVLRLYAWRDGSALLDVHYQGAHLGEFPLNDGDTCAPEGLPCAIRLDQTLSAAVAVPLDESPIWETILRRDGREYRVREGESTRIGDGLFRLDRLAGMPAVRYHFAVIREDA